MDSQTKLNGIEGATSVLRHLDIGVDPRLPKVRRDLAPGAALCVPAGKALAVWQRGRPVYLRFAKGGTVQGPLAYAEVDLDGRVESDARLVMGLVKSLVVTVLSALLLRGLLDGADLAIFGFAGVAFFGLVAGFGVVSILWRLASLGLRLRDRQSLSGLAA
ncbi:hypothetical protein [Palleronia sp.]|uniref:hypothetical protein n=1 Tax=Palleronia sp. TaxID=1940284 RepID=UPI0035C82F95